MTKHSGRTLVLIFTSSALLLVSLAKIFIPPPPALPPETLKTGMAKPVMELARKVLEETKR